MPNPEHRAKMHTLLSHYYLDYTGVSVRRSEDIYVFANHQVRVGKSYDGNEFWRISPYAPQRLSEVIKIRDCMSLARDCEFKKVLAPGDSDPSFIIGLALKLLPAVITVKISVTTGMMEGSYLVNFAWYHRDPVFIGFNSFDNQFYTRSPCLYPLFEDLQIPTPKRGARTLSVGR